MSLLSCAAKPSYRRAEPLLEHLARCCDRISTCEPHVRAFLPENGRRERILREGEKLEGQSQKGTLHGLLLGVKDIVAAEGFPTLCGSAIPPESLPELPSEASVVRSLLDAGMIVAGKTTTAEFANADPPPTGNPWNLNHTPGGSSSGSAAAVAAGMVHAAIGTQTIGSVNRPASFCGVCGYKPSYARLPTTGVAVFSPSADTLGFFTPSVEEMVKIAAVAVPDWRPLPNIQADRMPVLGIPEGPYLEMFSKESLAAFREAIVDLQHAGVNVRRVPSVMPEFEAIAKRHIAMTRREWATTLRGTWAANASLFRSQSAMEMIHALQVTSEELELARENRFLLRQQLEAAMDSNSIDLWITPGTLQGSAPLGLGSTGNSTGQLPWSHAGLPTLSLPAGFNTKVVPPLPLGLQLAARFGHDEALLLFGLQLEKLELAAKMRLCNADI